jgi:hypothetical protein
MLFSPRSGWFALLIAAALVGFMAEEASARGRVTTPRRDASCSGIRLTRVSRVGDIMMA